MRANGSGVEYNAQDARPFFPRDFLIASFWTELPASLSIHKKGVKRCKLIQKRDQSTSALFTEPSILTRSKFECESSLNNEKIPLFSLLYTGLERQQKGTPPKRWRAVFRVYAPLPCLDCRTASSFVTLFVCVWVGLFSVDSEVFQNEILWPLCEIKWVFWRREDLLFYGAASLFLAANCSLIKREWGTARRVRPCGTLFCLSSFVPTAFPEFLWDFWLNFQRAECEGSPLGRPGTRANTWKSSRTSLFFFSYSVLVLDFKAALHFNMTGFIAAVCSSMPSKFLSGITVERVMSLCKCDRP